MRHGKIVRHSDKGGAKPAAGGAEPTTVEVETPPRSPPNAKRETCQPLSTTTTGKDRKCPPGTAKDRQSRRTSGRARDPLPPPATESTTLVTAIYSLAKTHATITTSATKSSSPTPYTADARTSTNSLGTVSTRHRGSRSRTHEDALGLVTGIASGTKEQATTRKDAGFDLAWTDPRRKMRHKPRTPCRPRGDAVPRRTTWDETDTLPRSPRRANTRPSTRTSRARNRHSMNGPFIGVEATPPRRSGRTRQPPQWYTPPPQ